MTTSPTIPNGTAPTLAAEKPVKVIFRKWHNGAGIIALFPQIASDVHGHYCLSYEHIGQHGGASDDLNGQTSPATSAEYADLKLELERRGYVLAVGSRVTSKDRAIRYALTH